MYIGEMKCRLETHPKEYKDKCIKGFTDKSEHTWTRHHPISWDDTRILQRASHEVNCEGVSHEGSNLHMNSTESSHFDHDGGYDAPDCWIVTYKKIRGGAHAGYLHRTAS